MSCLVTSRLLSAAETIPMTKAEEKRMEAMQTTHLRRIHRIPYSAYVPNEPVRRSSKIFSIESRLMEARLRTWSLACRDSPHSFFRATMFGRAANERSSFEKKKQIRRTHQTSCLDVSTVRIRNFETVADSDLLIASSRRYIDSRWGKNPCWPDPTFADLYV